MLYCRKSVQMFYIVCNNLFINFKINKYNLYLYIFSSCSVP